jgi:hypothetical protein
LNWKYLNGTQTIPAAGLTTASVPIEVPTTPGAYTLRLMASGTIVATSPTVTVQ